MKTCEWFYTDLNRYCDNLCEGNSSWCGSHGRYIRKAASVDLKQQAKKERAKEKAKISNGYPKPKIKKVSEKQDKRLKVYNARVKDWKVENPKCKAKVSPLCDGKTEDCHHMKGKIGELLFNEQFWLPVCRSCHQFIGDNHAEAERRGLVLSRLATVKQTI